MPAKTWKLIENNEGLHVDKIIAPKDLGSEGKWFVEKVTLRDGLSEGVQKIGIQNGKMFLEVLPTRGMGIWKAFAGGESIGWQSPVRGPVHPKFVDLGEPSGLGWLDGFDELFCRCGLVSNGAADFDPQTGRLLYPVHGRIANRPAHAVEVTVDEGKEEISVKGIVEETRFHLTKLRMTSTITTKFNSTSFRVHDEILNFSASPAEIQMLYHINFGLPLLDAGSRVVLPAKTVVPRTPRAASGLKTWDSYAAPEPAWEEMVYFLDLHADSTGWTRTLLKNAHGTRGVSLVFNTQQLPWFTLWKNTTAEADGYVTGLEPGTNFPNPRSFEGEQERLVRLAPGGKQVFDVTMEIHTTAAEVKAAESAVARIRGGRNPQIFS
ncbi:MAG: aldose 1-epimerase family protein, partial [Planctomycetales bacterium]|nr:aldose 1-epimerase family protein [Planctomycetales bacterium]